MSANAETLVGQLADAFVDQVRRALGVQLDGSVTSLAFVDHHLNAARETMDDGHDEASGLPIAALVAAGAGCYYGELVRREMGGMWIGDGDNPRRLRLLLRHQFLHFSPVDQAIEALHGEELALDDPRVPEGPPFDSAFRASTEPGDTEASDASWLSARLAELSPVPADLYYSLTGRFETLELILGLLASRRAEAGDAPKELGVADYARELVREREAADDADA